MTQHQAPEVASEDMALAEEIVSAANIVSHDGYYEVDFDRAAATIAAHRTRATQPVSLTVDEGLDRALAAYNDVWQGAGTIDAGNVEAVRREAMIAALSALDRLQSLSLPVGDARELSEAPCDQCGYNGPGYYQTATHPCAARHHAAPTHGEVG